MEQERDGTSGHQGKTDAVSSGEYLPEFDHTTLEYRNRQHEILEQFRGRCPFGHSNRHGGFWYSLQPQVVRQVLNNATTFVSSRGLVTPPTPVPNTMIPINIDPPALYEWRALLNPLFSPDKMEKEAPRIREEALTLFDSGLAKGVVDMVNDVAQPLTGMTTLRLIGLEPGDWRDYAEPFHALAFGTVGAEEAAAGMMAMG
jgi:cytochrome P450